MFIFIALAVAALYTLLEIFLFTEKKEKGNIVRIVLRDMLSMPLLSIAVQKYVLHYKHFLSSQGYKSSNFVKFFIACLIVGLILELIFCFVKGKLAFKHAPEQKKKHTGLKVVSVVLFTLGCAAFFATLWGTEAFGNVTGDQLVINLTSSNEGAESGVYTDIYEGPVFNTLLCCVLFSIIVFSRVNLVYIKNKINKTVIGQTAKRVICFVLALACLGGGVTFGVDKFKLTQVYNAYVVKSDFIEDNYVDPQTTKITFPEKKRNLIHIYLESMEVSYLSKELGGNIDENLMPKLTKLADGGIVFSDTDMKFGGPQKGTGTQWSIASMVNQMSGLPMKAPGMHNAYGSEGNFLPGAYTLGELLEKEGYNQTVMFGASAGFGGLKYLFEDHGKWKILDYDYAKAHNMLPSKNYKVWWGYEDDKLYDFAKDELTRLYKEGKPFNLTMEDADTHRPGGYISKGKKKPFKSHYASAIWNSDRDVYKFVKWIQKQPFYENTTIVLIGDHCSMDTKFFKEYNFTDDYNRRQFNLILNPAPADAHPSEKITRNRKWANWDMFPTIVSSLGAQIDGDRLGIGTNLFSGKKTVYEQYGVKKVDKELEKKSVFYNDKILEGKGMQAAHARSKKPKKKLPPAEKK